MPRVAKKRTTRKKTHARRPVRRFTTGRGAYKIPHPRTFMPKGFFRKAGALLGSAGGAAFGNFVAPGVGMSIGREAGSRLGELGGDLLSRIVGFGAYSIKQNTLMYPATAQTIVPSFGEDSIIVRKREYVGEINATAAFTNTSFPINPGVASTFPWLANIARNYEQYRFNGLIFEFVSTSSDAIASTTDLGLGQVMLATDYNAADVPYSDAAQMLNAMFSNSGKPSQNIIHAIECAPTDQAQKLYYIRTGAAPAGTDIRLYDMGNFQIATQNMPSGYTGMGQLWATYDITFCKSVEFNEEDAGSLADKYSMTSVSNAHPLGNGRTLEPSSNLGTTIDSNGTTITWPNTIGEGFYMVAYIAYAAGPEATAAFTWTLSNCTTVNWALGNAFPSVTNAGDTTAALIRVEIIELTAPSASIIMSGGTVPLPSTGADLLIIELPSSVFGNLSALALEETDGRDHSLIDARIAELAKAIDELRMKRGETVEDEEDDTVVISRQSSDTESLDKKKMHNSLRHSLRRH